MYRLIIFCPTLSKILTLSPLQSAILDQPYQIFQFSHRSRNYSYFESPRVLVN